MHITGCGYSDEMATKGPAQDVTTTVGRGMVAGLAGTLAMTAFQRLVEMPLTGRPESYAPANLAQKVLPIAPRTPRERRVLNTVTHYAVGALWGVAHGMAERAGLRGQRAVATVFGLVYTGDAILNTALGLYEPWRWSGQDWAVDLADKLLLAQVTGLVYERLDPLADGRNRTS